MKATATEYVGHQTAHDARHDDDVDAGSVHTARSSKARTSPRAPPRLLTDIEAAEYINSSRSYVRALVANGVIKRVELPATDGSGARARLWRIDKSDLDRWIEKLKP